MTLAELQEEVVSSKVDAILRCEYPHRVEYYDWLDANWVLPRGSCYATVLLRAAIRYRAGMLIHSSTIGYQCRRADYKRALNDFHRFITRKEKEEAMR